MRFKGDNIFWDLDGVLRDLTYKFHSGDIDSWDKVNGSGKTVIEYVEEDLSVLTNAPECEYMDIAKRFYPIHVVSAQPDHWRKLTSEWLDAHIPGARIKYLLDTHHKLRYLTSGNRVLVEDCPMYLDYSNIILIDRPYNQGVHCERRIYTSDELLFELRRFLNGKDMGRNKENGK